MNLLSFSNLIQIKFENDNKFIWIMYSFFKKKSQNLVEVSVFEWKKCI